MVCSLSRAITAILIATLNSCFLRQSRAVPSSSVTDPTGACPTGACASACEAMEKTRQNGKSIRNSIVVTGAWSLCAIGVAPQFILVAAENRPRPERSNGVARPRGARPWASLSLCFVCDHDPGGPVVARSFPAADLAIDACTDQTCGRRRAQKQMIDT